MGFGNERHRIGMQGRLLCGLFLIVLLLAGCGNAGTGSDDGKLKVTTTIGMITDVVKQVGGEHVEVTGLMGEGVDPHTFKASQGDVRRLDQASIIFYNGLFLEAQMAEVLEAMDGKKRTVAVAEALDTSTLLEGDVSIGETYDPHVWFDVANWIEVTKVIRDELQSIDPDHADDYAHNAETYIAQLTELHDYAKEQLATIPEERRVLVTAHDAFGYFGRAYDIEVRGVQGISTASEAGLKDVADLRKFMIERGIKAIFAESSVNDKNIKAIIEGAKAEGFEIKEGGVLYADAMGEEGTPEGTYIGMVRHNVDTIVSALK